MDAIAKGTTDGIVLLINIIAMLIVAIALVAQVNQGLGLIHWGDGPLTLHTTQSGSEFVKDNSPPISMEHLPGQSSVEELGCRNRLLPKGGAILPS